MLQRGRQRSWLTRTSWEGEAESHGEFCCVSSSESVSELRKTFTSPSGSLFHSRFTPSRDAGSKLHFVTTSEPRAEQ